MASACCRKRVRTFVCPRSVALATRLTYVCTASLCAKATSSTLLLQWANDDHREWRNLSLAELANGCEWRIWIMMAVLKHSCDRFANSPNCASSWYILCCSWVFDKKKKLVDIPESFFIFITGSEYPQKVWSIWTAHWIFKTVLTMSPTMNNSFPDWYGM